MQKIETIMFYNVENLFLPFDKNLSSSKIYSFGLEGWNEKRYLNKIQKIAHVIELLKLQVGETPMLIGLSEIQGKKPVEDLAALVPFTEDYDIVHYESMDERSVDVALLYDKSKLTLIESEPITYFFEIEDGNRENYDTTRDVLYCKFNYQDIHLHIYVLHLPSKREADINKPKRDYILNNLKERIQSLQQSINDHVIILGDFNENPNEENINNLVDQQEFPLFNPFAELFYRKHYSTFHYKDGLLFDQMILSKNFMKPGSRAKFLKAGIFNPIKISNWDKRFAGRPFRTYAGTRYLGGYSDHFPIFTQFQVNP